MCGARSYGDEIRLEDCSLASLGKMDYALSRTDERIHEITN